MKERIVALEEAAAGVEVDVQDEYPETPPRVHYFDINKYEDIQETQVSLGSYASLRAAFAWRAEEEDSEFNAGTVNHGDLIIGELGSTKVFCYVTVNDYLQVLDGEEVKSHTGWQWPLPEEYTPDTTGNPSRSYLIWTSGEGEDCDCSGNYHFTYYSTATPPDNWSEVGELGDSAPFQKEVEGSDTCGIRIPMFTRFTAYDNSLVAEGRILFFDKCGKLTSYGVEGELANIVFSAGSESVSMLANNTYEPS